MSEGTYTAKVIFEDDIGYANNETEVTFNVTKVVTPVDTALNVTTPENATSPVFTVTLPSDATGYLLLDVDGNQTFVPLVNGTASVAVPKLAPGNYSATVTYTGDNKYAPFTKETNVPDSALTIPETSDSSSPTFSINLPSDATGYLFVDVDGTKYAAALVNGSASVTVPGLSEGKHNVTVTYSGDAKYSTVTKNTVVNVHVPVIKLTKNTNIKMLYTAKKPYKVLVTKDGKAVSGAKVVIKGYATFKIPNVKPKKAKYTITASYAGKTVKNTVKVNTILKVGNKKVKKSRKVTKVKFALKKVNGKFLKGKTLKLKFKGKTYKAKTNKKGVATFKLQKKVFKKLKVGKKYSFKVTYAKDVATKKFTIKK